MQKHPFISVILLGDHSIDEIDLCLKSLKKMNYPHDQLEFYLLIPYYRPLSEFAKTFPKLRIIRFDETIDWTQLGAQLEGLSFARGDYIQFFNAGYSFRSNWFKIGLEYIRNKNVTSVCSNDVDKIKNNLTSDSFSFIDGFYSAAMLKHFIENNINELAPSDFGQDDSLNISEPMVDLKKINPYHVSQDHLFGNRLRSILSKYVLAK